MQQLKVTYSDGRDVLAGITPRAEVDFERKFEMSVTRVSQRNEYVYWLAHHALELSGDESRPFDEWLFLIDSVRELDEEEVPDPSPSSPPTADSSGSAAQPTSPSVASST